ncbi:RNA 2'-phosphotransferase [Hymenobacter crusticola]|uniref:Probable RNA 2'-phosphotransferase n=1 Tax=Hymenobacter crusticola TaxID=1770526 RepID=A0A243WGU1_9BACT|nr:RNA 2'-phosphotransferase [Hymenobacter crusticola]OUJ74758.1 RNA 2'-phosphotransferase [Hymenobacter crusticola]
MNKNRQIMLSKFLSKYLRHEPETIGLELREGGWIPVAELLEACTRQGQPLTHLELSEIVTTSDKKRFAFDATGTLIRAQQGHSVPVDLQLAPAVPPAVLYHGTVAAALPAIWQEGLQKMSRHHVHLSPDVETARRVGARRGKPVLLAIDAAALHSAGSVLYESGNGVWLVDQVPSAFLRELAD